jgi:predicted amidohydrolase YtcJ
VPINTLKKTLVGKLVDLVLLDNNPIDIAVASIKDVQVMQTYTSGKLIYSPQ